MVLLQAHAWLACKMLRSILKQVTLKFQFCNNLLNKLDINWFSSSWVLSSHNLGVAKRRSMSWKNFDKIRLNQSQKRKLCLQYLWTWRARWGEYFHPRLSDQDIILKSYTETEKSRVNLQYVILVTGLVLVSAETVSFSGEAVALKTGSTEATTVQHCHHPYLLHGRRHIAARLKSDDHSRQERGGLGDRGGVMDIHS